jgi:hypothetical protein
MSGNPILAGYYQHYSTNSVQIYDKPIACQHFPLRRREILSLVTYTQLVDNSLL